MDENKNLRIYSAHFTFYRDRIYEKDGSRGIVQIKYRPKKGKQRERILPVSEISINGLVWDRVKIWPTRTKEIIARYERFKDKEDGIYKYRDIKRNIIPTSLTQKLDDLIYESFNDNLKINDFGC